MKTVGALAIILLAGLVVCATVCTFANSDLGSRVAPRIGDEGLRARGEWGRAGQGFRGGRSQGELELREREPAGQLPQGRSEDLGQHRGERGLGFSTATLATWSRNLLVMALIVLAVVLPERLIASGRARRRQPAPS
jgi:hypothetical protein